MGFSGSELVLLCGGPAIYGTGVPKPLQLVRGRETLLELYINSGPFANVETANLLVERRDLDAFEEVLDRLGSRALIHVSEDQSSTAQKILGFCERSVARDQLHVFTYPDIFFFGDLGQEFYEDESKIWLSSRTMSSRFPRFFAEPYSSKLLSISPPHEQEGSNRVLMYGGHIVSRPNVLVSAINEWLADSDSKGGVLEERGFAHFVRCGLARHFELRGDWYQADNAREISKIAARVN